MKGFEGNKTLLPLEPGDSAFQGTHPVLIHILHNLPPGPKAVVVNHRKEEVIEATRSLGLTYFEQPVLNGTGGALIAARPFIEAKGHDQLIITMGDLPLVRDSTYFDLLKGLKSSPMVVLGFLPMDKKQYGVLEIGGHRVERITEWKYWSAYPKKKQEQLRICNSGVYAARKDALIRYLSILEGRPHTVIKERDGRMVEIEEFFITDLVGFMHQDGLEVGYAVADDENEVMGIDDLSSLMKAQDLFRESRM
jgi:bifunctional UDP-N-acetylglucosamine pyrophosphorylase/glucosamine-1-phosphate N-acetyltransferase